MITTQKRTDTPHAHWDDVRHFRIEVLEKPATEEDLLDFIDATRS